MKKTLIIIGIITVLLGLGYFLYTRDNIRFKISYEIINSDKDSNGKSIKVKIPFKNNVNYLSVKELNNFLENGTGIVYFGYSSCPWCRNIVPILVEVAKENNLKINYVDIESINIKDTNILEKLDEYLREKDGVKGLAVPDVYVIKDGKVLGHHIGTVESYTNPYKGMNDDEKKELKEIYLDMIKELR